MSGDEKIKKAGLKKNNADVIRITKAMRNLIKSEIKRTGVGPTRILKDVAGKNLGLSPDDLHSLIQKRSNNQKIRSDQWERIISLWAELPNSVTISEKIPITNEMRKLIKSEIKRTGVGYTRVLKKNKLARELGIKPELLNGLLNQSDDYKTIREDQWEFLKSLWSGLPDCEKYALRLNVTPEMIELMQSEIKRTGKGPRSLLIDQKEAQKIGLKDHTIWNLLSEKKTIQTVRKDHWELMIQLWSSLPDVDIKYRRIAVTPKLVESLRHEIERTGVEPISLLKEYPEAKLQGLSLKFLRSLLKKKPVQSVRRDYWELAIRLWKELPDCHGQSNPRELLWGIQQAHELKKQVQNTKMTPSELLKSRDDLPENLNKSLLLSLLQGEPLSVSAHTVEYLYKICEEYTQSDKFTDKSNITEIHQRDRDALKSEMNRTGLSLARIITINKHQHLISGDTLYRIANNRQKRCNVEHVKAVLEWYSKIPDKQEKTEFQTAIKRPLAKEEVRIKHDLILPISEKDLSKLKKIHSNTGMLPSAIFKRLEAPDHINAAMVSRWIRHPRKALPEDIKWLISSCEKLLVQALKSIPEDFENLSNYPQSYLTMLGPLRKQDVSSLLLIRDLTKILPSKLFDHVESIPPGLNSHEIRGWLNHRGRKAHPKHVIWVLKNCKQIIEETLT